MASTTTNLLLKVWNSLSDTFNHSELASNWSRIDQHDHTGSGKGLQIPAGGLAPGAVENVNLASDAVDGSVIADDSIGGIKLVDGSVDVDKLVAAVQARLLPVGQVAGLLKLNDVGVVSGSLTLDSIPNTPYKHLRVIGSCISTSSSSTDHLKLRINNDTATHYDWRQRLLSIPTASADDSGTNDTSIEIGLLPRTSTDQWRLNFELDILNYLEGYPSVLYRWSSANGSGATVGQGVGRRLLNEGVNRIDLFSAAGLKPAYSTVQLYAYV